ncbi:MAG: ATP-binding protein [Acidovorax sp.]|uniref:sensor histidine kinase n=1 Tax=Acidovorax sp. TaxID=1872122 RepID=UPI00260950D0|nr:ATP-binding protein [Acidovorax sp.]MDH4428276.1 ATP-binding protein [Acidovorax sp.]
MWRTVPAWQATTCVGLCAAKLALVAAALGGLQGMLPLSPRAQSWCLACAMALGLPLCGLLLTHRARALRWRPRLSHRPSPDVVAERRRIARELHDRVGSQLVTALTLAGAGQPGEPVRTALERCLFDLRMVVDSMDSDDASVTDRLARLRHRIQPALERRGIRMVWDVQVIDDVPPLQRHCAGHLAAIVQEALSNALQHSGATQVCVSVHFLVASGAWHVEISDNGRGLRVPPGDGETAAGSGLAGMRWRARQAGGKLRFQSGPEGGTCVSVFVPGDAAVV